MAGNHWKFSIRLGVVSVFILATALTASIAIGLQYYFNYQQSLQKAKEQYQATAEQTADHLERIDHKAEEITRSLSRYRQLTGTNGDIVGSTLALFAETLSIHPNFYSLYLGFDDGRFFELINLQASDRVRERLKARPGERWVRVTISRDQSLLRKRVQYLDDNLKVIRERSGITTYDPRTRPWYLAAETDQVATTPPYLLDVLNSPGKTYSSRLPDADAVIGLDITLATITDHLRSLPVATGTELYLYDNDGALIASNAPPLDRRLEVDIEPLALGDREQALVEQYSPLKVSNELDWPPVDFAISGKPAGYAIDMLQVVSSMTGLEFTFINGFTWTELVDLFQQGKIDVLQPILHSRDNEKLGAFSEPFINLPFGLAFPADAPPVTHLDQLHDQVLAIGEGWSIIPAIRQQFPEITIREYPSTLAGMKAVRRGEADAAIDNAIVLQFNRRQFFLSDLAIHDGDIGLPADSGTLHLMMREPDRAMLGLLNRALANIPERIHEQLREKWLKETQILSRYTATIPYPQLLKPAAGDSARLAEFSYNQTDYFRYARSLGNGSAMNFAAVANSDVITGPATRHALWAAGITTVCILILLPTAGLFAAPIVRPIKRLEAQSLKVKDRQYDQITRVKTHIIETEKLADSLYDMAQSIREHEKKQEALMEAFIELIAEAIDEKSPYTGAHCARVPALGLMLAEQASLSADPPFLDFSLDDENKRREFRIAAWLHDCGKITTPEHIVDKGAKLETIHNRIHEIRTRFEVLWRDAEIDYWQRRHDNPAQTDQLEKELDARRHTLQEQFAFVADANVGGEVMSEDDKARIREIAKQTWVRHFDDRLGLSPLQQRQLGPSTDPLPVTETLLQDKPEHLVPHEREPEYAEHLGIRMTVPKYRANLGEVHNLTIERGTLTDEDRFKINEHIINTIKMLDGLPFPPELAKVPKYASTHHERLDGKGYPRKLGAEDMEIPDRILAVADIFEALTAADRPYKSAKPLSQSLTIMQHMVDDGHIDGDVFNLFLESGVCDRYAQLYLSVEQIDVEDVTAYSVNLRR